MATYYTEMSKIARRDRSRDRGRNGMRVVGGSVRELERIKRRRDERERGARS